MRYIVSKITGEFALSFDDGQQLFDLIFPQLLTGQTVELDFAGVTSVSTAFFNVAIGQLLQDIHFDTLNEKLVIENLSPYGKTVLSQVIENAKPYYSDPAYRQAVDTVMEEYAASF
jgi:STAS-like domain of unknown function (DUF4325)